MIRTDCGQGRHHLDEPCPGCPDCEPCGECGGSRIETNPPDDNGLVDMQSCPFCGGTGVEGGG